MRVLALLGRALWVLLESVEVGKKGRCCEEQHFPASPDLPPAVSPQGLSRGGMLQSRALGHRAGTGTSLAAWLCAQLSLG